MKRLLKGLGRLKVIIQHMMDGEILFALLNRHTIEYIVAACNSLPDLIKYIHELEECIKILNTLNERKLVTRVFTSNV